ncbi:MAG: DUF6252 family protein [Bacteroidales bacterium]
MKIKSLIAIMASLLSVVFFNSCEDNTTDQNRPLMTALLDGSTWRSPEPNARVSDNQILVYGTSADGQSIQLTIYSGEKGVYTLNASNMHEGVLIPNTSAYADIYSTSNNDSGTGQVRISSINEDDETISGTFNFRAYKQNSNSSKVITNGEFTKVPYKYINTIDTTDVVNILTANIESEAFDANSVATSDTTYDNTDYIKISGSTSTDFKSIKLFIPQDVQEDVYNIDPNNGPAMAYYQESLTEMPAIAGSTTISHHDTENQILKGSFFFNVEDGGGQTINITGGYFEVQY